MVTDRELERLLEGRYKALTPDAQREMAHDLLVYRRAARQLLAGDKDPVRGSIESFVERRK